MSQKLVTRIVRINPAFKIVPLLFLFFHSAYGIDRCVTDGKVTYTDRDCPANSALTTFNQQVAQPNDPAAANERYLVDKRKLQQINAQKAREEVQQKHDAQVASYQNSLAKNHEIRCNNLKLRQQLATEQQADAKQHGNQKKLNRSTTIII